MQGGAKGYNALTRNLRNIEDKHADQLAGKHATPYRIYVLLLLNRHGWKEVIFINACSWCFVQSYTDHYVIKILKRRVLRLCIERLYMIEYYIRI